MNHLIRTNIKSILKFDTREVTHKTITVPVDDPEVDVDHVSVSVPLIKPYKLWALTIETADEVRVGDIYRDGNGICWYTSERNQMFSDFHDAPSYTTQSPLVLGLIASTFKEGQ